MRSDSTLEVTSAGSALALLAPGLAASQVEVVSDLESIFLELTGEPTGEEAA